MSYENIKLNLNGNHYPISQQNEVKDIEEFENVFFSEDGEYEESWISFSDKQVSNSASSNVKNEKEELTEEEILIQQLEAEIAQLESEYSANQEGKGIAGAVGGFFSSCWNGIKGKGFKNNDRAELDAKIAMLEAVKSDPAKLNEAYKTIMGTELTEEARQSAVEAQKLADSMSEEEKQQVVEMLQEQAASLSTLMEQTQDDQGWFSKAMGGLNNVLGFGTNSNKANAKVEEYIKQVNSLDPNDPDFAAKYQALTGEALSVDGLDELSQGVSKVGNSPAAEAIMDYEETQAAAKEIGSGIVTGLVVAACVIAAPFTGGASIALGAAVGGATTVLINGTDTIGTSKKYSLEQGILDFGGGAINGAITAMTLGGAGIAGKGFSALKGAGSAAAKQGAKQMVSSGFKNTAKTAFKGFGKSALNGAKIAAFATSSNYLLDTVGTNALYELTGNLSKSETPANIVQNEDGTYSVYYELTDANTGEVISYEIETVDSLAQDEDGGLIKGNVIDVSRSNDFSFTEMAKQTAISAGTAALGAGIGKITGNIINPYTTSMTNSVILGNIAEISADMSLSLSADYLIASAQAGHFVDADEFFSWDRILGEGQNQIRGLLIGIASSKMNSVEAVSADAVRAGFDGKTGSDGAEIPVVKPDEAPETAPLTSSAIKNGETSDSDPVPPATIKPESTDNAATEPIKIDGTELPKTQQEVIKKAGELALTGDEVKAKQLLEAFGMKPSEIDQFMAEVHNVKATTQTATTTQKDIEYQKLIDQQVDKLRKTASMITFENFKTLDGKDTVFEVFKGTQGGSNEGYYVRNTETGELFYAKVGNEQSKAEVLASKLYQLAGVNAPELQLYESASGKTGLLSKFIPNLTPVSSPKSGLSDGFGMDILLANWDAVCSNNAVTDGTNIYRIDLGGTFDYRAQGFKKPFTGIVDEITTLINPNVNYTSANLFSAMTRTDMIDSIKKVTAISDADIIKVLEAEGMEGYKDVILQRKAFLTEFVKTAEATPQKNNQTLLQYNEAIKNSVLEKVISDSKTQTDIAQIQQSINKVQDPQTKTKLQGLLDAKLHFIKTGSVKSTPISRSDFDAIISSSGFKKTISGFYALELPDDVKNVIYTNYGTYGSKIVSLMQKELSPQDFDQLYKYMNVSGGKYASYWKEHMPELVASYTVINQYYGGLFQNFDVVTDGQWAAIMSTVTYKAPENVVEALHYYKSDSWQINTALTNKKNNKYAPISPEVQARIDAISKYMETQALTEPMHVYRGEGFEVLQSVKLANGQTLASALQKLQYTTDLAAADKIVFEVLQSNYEAYQERFMSTSFLESSCFGGDISWDLELPAGTKGTYLEAQNVTGTFAHEVEYLVGKDAKIEITDIKPRVDSTGTITGWDLKGKVVSN